MPSPAYKREYRHTPEWWMYRVTLWLFAAIGFIDVLTDGGMWL